MRHLKYSVAAAMLFAACVNTQPLTAQSVKVVTVTVDSPTVALGHRTSAHVIVRLSNGRYSTTKPVTWGTSKPGVAVVSTSGLVSTIATGSTAIAAIVGGVKGEATVTVTPIVAPPPPPAPAPVVSIAVSLARSSLAAGAATQATAIPRDSAGDPLTGRAVDWSSTDPTVATVSETGVVTAVATGTASIRAIVQTKVGSAALTVTAAPPPPAVDTAVAPHAPVTLTTTVASTPSTGRTLHVAANGNLQTAFDTARAGDRILLAARAVYTGNYTIPAKGTCGSGAGWITVQSDTTLPAEGTRISPATAAGVASIRSPNVLPALQTASCAARWRFVGIEVTVATGVTYNQGLVQLGDGATTQTTASAIARNLVLDRMYIHGTPTLDMRRCVGLNSDSTAIIESFISDCHSIGFDAQAIAGWNGNGPYKIANNYLDASTEVVSFGGADPSIANLVPSDITIIGNHITRPMAWKGGPWLIKNLIELKNARRVVISGNVLENSWPNGQYGWAFVFWSVNQTGTCTWCITSDVLVENNLIRNVAAFAQLTDMYRGEGSVPALPMTRIAITNNVVIGFGNDLVGNGGYGFLLSNTVRGLTIAHNTLLSPVSPAWVFPAGAAPRAFFARDNLTGGQCGTYNQMSMQAAFTTIADTSSRFVGNVIACMDDYTHALPAGNFFPVSLAAIGFAGGAGAAYSVTATPDSLALTNASPYHNAGTDGTDIGADIAAVNAAIAGVVQSVPLGARRPIPIRKP